MIDASLKNANILIVDDQEANIDVLEGLLLIQGYLNIKTTTDPRNVVSLLSSFQPDIILLDLAMPHLSGFEVLEQIKEIVPIAYYLPILVLTADITLEARERALSNGAKDFLVKPFDLTEANLRIHNLLETRYLYQQQENQNHILEEKVKERTKELVIAKEKAEESDRLKTAFLNNISHEIRTPFNGIIGLLSMLIEDAISKEEKEEYVNMINYSADRLMNTINDIVEISQIQAEKIELSISKVNIDYLINVLIDKFKTPTENKQLDLIIKNNLPSNIENINTDKLKLISILSYIIDNAIKFTNAGNIELGIDYNSDFLMFFVKDTGVGINKNDYTKIFERFMQVDVSNTRLYEGSGLGLSIAKTYTEILGGKIWVESEINKGSIFYISIPIISK
ncbi:MAG: response regulator [Bacteroidota bacterium]